MHVSFSGGVPQSVHLRLWWTSWKAKPRRVESDLNVEGKPVEAETLEIAETVNP